MMSLYTNTKNQIYGPSAIFSSTGSVPLYMRDPFIFAMQNAQEFSSSWMLSKLITST